MITTIMKLFDRWLCPKPSLVTEGNGLVTEATFPMPGFQYPPKTADDEKLVVVNGFHAKNSRWTEGVRHIASCGDNKNLFAVSGRSAIYSIPKLENKKPVQDPWLDKIDWKNAKPSHFTECSLSQLRLLTQKLLMEKLHVDTTPEVILYFSENFRPIIVGPDNPQLRCAVMKKIVDRVSYHDNSYYFKEFIYYNKHLLPDWEMV